MSPFPTVDPIPVPAPIWLLKALHIVTMSLHFVAVQMLLGGLIVAILFHVLSRKGEYQTAAAAIARRLPIVMTYVINLGVPPLLFAQVLYGRALYTSSVLIGAWWIAVIPLLAIAYYQLYHFSNRLDQGQRGWYFGVGSLLLVSTIAKIYTSNMTLMLRPEAWAGMYQYSPAGAFLPTGDPTMPWRLLTMFCGAFLIAGLWMLWLSGRSTFEEPAARLLATVGGRLAAVMAIVELFVVQQLSASQPSNIRQVMGADGMAQGAAYGWEAMVAAALMVGILGGFNLMNRRLLAWGALLVAVVRTASMTVYRDVLRDQTLLSKGFDVWQRTIVTNWGVVVLFLVVFVAGLAALGWLISVVARATRVMEKTA